MKDILEEIIAYKQIEVEMQQQAFPSEILEDHLTDAVPLKRSMRQALEQSATGIIAEFKRRSPSKGWIKKDAKVEEIIPDYERNGATALSILTDAEFFGGSLRDIREARALTDLPILRKDFIVSEYQLLQAKAVGADAVLLIAACLTPEECRNLSRKAHGLDMEVLLEIHSEKELEYLNEEIDMVGVNNRNLGTFHTDVENSLHLAELLPKDRVRISESGISSAETMAKLRNAGFRGFLIGETFMKTEHPADTLHRFIKGGTV